MSISTIRAAIKTKLDSVASVGKTLDYVYWTDDWSAIYDTFAEGGRVDVWMIGWSSSTGNRRLDDITERNYTMNLFGLYSIQTSAKSSKTFEDIIEDVMEEFSESLSFTPGTIYTPPMLIALENGVYVKTPVHRAQLQFTVTESIAQELACNG